MVRGGSINVDDSRLPLSLLLLLGVSFPIAFNGIGLSSLLVGLLNKLIQNGELHHAPVPQISRSSPGIVSRVVIEKGVT